ncbi:MAG: hypothetical protein IJW21_02495, partial [Clostridia bacterium]|nr:hypothetical protein [Clostridia bacterium]
FIFGEYTVSGIAMIGAGIALAGLAIFSFFACRVLTNYIIKFTKKIPAWIKSLFTKKEAA